MSRKRGELETQKSKPRSLKALRTVCWTVAHRLINRMKSTLLGDVFTGEHRHRHVNGQYERIERRRRGRRVYTGPKPTYEAQQSKYFLTNENRFERVRDEQIERRYQEAK